jgi:hypothetical protein
VLGIRKAVQDEKSLYFAVCVIHIAFSLSPWKTVRDVSFSNGNGSEIGN